MCKRYYVARACATPSGKPKGARMKEGLFSWNYKRISIAHVHAKVWHFITSSK